MESICSSFWNRRRATLRPRNSSRLSLSISVVISNEVNSPDNHAQQEQEEQDDVYSPITQNKINNADKGVIESLKLANQFASR